MKLQDLVNHATDKSRFQSLKNYILFCEKYLEFVESGLQAQIVSQFVDQFLGLGAGLWNFKTA